MGKGQNSAHVSVCGRKVGMVPQSVCHKHASLQDVGEQDQRHEAEDGFWRAGTGDLQILQCTNTDDCSDHIIGDDRYRREIVQHLKNISEWVCLCLASHHEVCLMEGHLASRLRLAVLPKPVGG